MKYLSIGVLALGAFTSDVASADEFSWSGLYIFGQASAESSSLEGRFVQPNGNLTLPSSFENLFNGSAGVGAGFNLQIDNAVIGFEARWSGSSIGESENVSFGSYSQSREVEDTIHIGPKLGYAMSRLQVYGTAGLASAGYRTLTTDVSFGGGSTTLRDTEDRLYGYFVGAGIEWAPLDSIFVGLQYDRTTLTGKNESWISGAGNLNVFESENPVKDQISLRVGLRF